MSLNKVVEWIKSKWGYAVSLVLLIVIGSLILTTRADGIRKDAAKSVVLDLYDFGSTDQLVEQQNDLRTRVTKEVYNQLTYDNEERRLNTYLKFCDDASTVNFEKVTKDYVIYSLDCATIEKTRKFIFMYKVNSMGKICEVREAELLDFMKGTE